MHFDVFNGDADGICSLLQLRLATPMESTLITGVKRDIKLLEQVSQEEANSVTVLDVSMQKNHAALVNLLDNDVDIFYCDHHQSGDIPDHTRLTALINTDANVCTSLLINGHLKGQFPAWAIAGAFGDNLKASAIAVAKPLNISEKDLVLLEKIGTYINYNGYGASLDDLHFPPAMLYKKLLPYASPNDFINEDSVTFEKLETGFIEDNEKAAQSQSCYQREHAAVFILPNETWARRVSGVYSNDLANNHPRRAHAVLTEKGNGNYLVSVRAPLANKQGAELICSQFPTGGGRAAAAGINDLPVDQLGTFVDTFQAFYRKQ